MYKNFISIDLEMAQPSGLIIQLGAIAANIETGEILEELSLFINPNEKLTDYIINLTGITQEQVDEGIDINNAYKVLVEFKKRNNCFHCPITWGSGDMETLKKQIDILPKDWAFGRSYFDTKKLFQSYCIANNLKLQSGLAKSLNRMNLTFEGRKHNALSDAKNTFKIYRQLIQYFKRGKDV